MNRRLTSSIAAVSAAAAMALTLAPAPATALTVTAVTAGPDNAPLLDVDADTALLHIVRYARSGTHNVEFCSSVYRTDRYRLTTRAKLWAQLRKPQAPSRKTARRLP